MILGEQNAAALAQEIAGEIASELGISLQQAMAATNTALGTGQQARVREEATYKPPI